MNQYPSYFFVVVFFVPVDFFVPVFLEDVDFFFVVFLATAFFLLFLLPTRRREGLGEGNPRA